MEKTKQSNFMVSPEFQAFFDVLLEAPVEKKMCFEAIERAIALLEKELPIGRLDVKVYASATRIQPEGERIRATLYQKGKKEKRASLHFAFKSEVGGRTAFDIYAPFEYVYSEEEKQNLEFIAKQLFVFIGRARAVSLFERTLVEDGLTGIPNLTTFYAHGSRLITKGKLSRYDALHFNVKNFKYINKRVNYQGGDQIMVQYAHAVCGFLIEDEMIARLGGDNYVALIRRDRTKDFLKYLQDITVELETSGGVQEVSLGAVSGIYEIEDHVKRMGDVMNAISTAMQAAKQVYKKEYVYYTPELSQSILYEKEMAQEFVESMADGKFITYLQPKINLKDNTICGAEALARWKYQGHVVKPDQFVPMLEKDGAVCMLDFEILRQACSLISNWKKRGKKPVRLSVNLSNWNLHSKTLVENIMEILNEYEVEPEYIEIELSETTDYGEYSIMAELYRELKKQGITTSLDNFGLGFSSLSMLKNLEVDVLKLDKEIIADIEDDEEGYKNQVMIRNIIDMAKKMNMKVLAEGVETTRQRDFLIQADCDIAQGFLYAKPLQIEEFERRIYK